MTLSNFPSKFPIVWEFERPFAVGFIAHCARALHYIPDKSRHFPKNPAFSLPKLYIFYALISRAEYQAAHLLNHSVKRGMNWRDMPEVYQVSVLNFIYDRDSDNGVSVYTMRTEDGRTLSRRMAIVFVELPKYRGSVERVENLTAAEKWCKFLLYADDSARRSLVSEICKSDGGIMAASGILTKISQDDINWSRQTSIDLWERDQLSTKNYIEELTQKLAEKTAESQAALAEKDAQLSALLREIELLRAELANKKQRENYNVR
ncbi:MAG: hypothetical protein HDR54_04100 [Treponema sp.]|nr:hypothetical protein [Treponema sp.]